MKNTFIMLLAAMLFCLPALGQEDVQTRKVAILETIDREGTISTGVKLLVRSNLARAISSTPGYEGYDRVDVASIMGEQDFQRTGMVNNDQIKKLGEMTGTSDIVVTEVAMIDSRHIIITAKILDVETAHISDLAHIQTGISSSELDKGCRELAEQLLGLKKSSNITTIARPNKEKIKVPKEKKETKKIVFKPKYSGDIELGYALDIGGDDQNMSAAEISTVHGCALFPFLYIGAGLMVRYHPFLNQTRIFEPDTSSSDKNTFHEAKFNEDLISVPVFASIRFTYPKGKVHPFLDTRIGYDIMYDMLHTTIAIGINIKHIDLSIGSRLFEYRHLHYTDIHNYDYTNTKERNYDHEFGPYTRSIFFTLGIRF